MRVRVAEMAAKARYQHMLQSQMGGHIACAFEEKYLVRAEQLGKVLLLCFLFAWPPATVVDEVELDSLEPELPVAGPSSHETLPEEVVPLRYDLQLTLDPERSTTFEGHVSIHLNITRETSSIMFNARNLVLESIVLFQAIEQLQPAEVLKDAGWERVTLHFREALSPGNAVLQISYAGEMGKDMAGLYTSRYKSRRGWKTLALTQFEAIDARRMLPCWDEPSRKAVFALSVVVPAELMAVSNMPAASETTLERGKRRITFLDTPRMSSYLLALAVGRFDTIQAQTVNGTLIRVLTMPGQAAQGTFALSVAARALSYYEEYFGVPFPLPKLDMLAAPDFAAGAMENWGLVIYREVDLLCNETTVGVARKVRIATVVTHELSHMWFGNLVTMEWWDQLWLNEGFANWMQTQAVDVLFPEWHIWEQYVVEEQSRALQLDALRSSHPVEVPIRRAKEVDEVFDAISYCKGGSVVRMVNGVLGKELFRKGLGLYMRRFAYRNTDSTDLWSCWEEVSGMPLMAMMSSWTKQQGFPVLMVNETKTSRTGGSSRLLLSQRWFLADGSEEPEEGNHKKLWQIPLLPGPGGTDDHLIMESPEMRWEKKDGFLKFNFGQVAPYRVLYDSSLYGSLSQALRNGQVNALDRIGLLLDALAFAKQGKLPMAQLLGLVSAYKGEKSTHVWQALSEVLSTLHRMASFAESSFSALTDAVGNGMLRDALQEVGIAASAKETDLTRHKRALILRLMAMYLPKDKALAEEAKLRFERWLNAQDLQDTLPDDLKTSIFKIVLTNAETDAPYNALRRYARRTDIPQAVRLSIYTALGSAKRKDLRMKTLDMATGGRSGVRLQDIMYPVQGVSQADPDGAQLAWRWFIQRRRSIMARLKGANVRLLGVVIQLAAGAVPDKAHANAVEAFFQQHPVPGLERSIAQVVENVRTDAKFMMRFEDEMQGEEMKELLKGFEL
ncbi:Puromycin-sensitive aminopeptidase (PSA) (Cytosol alanyl aminopeptidase) (AAP-S) [Durusdinium trenchii]|uniref:Aminopeptidase n=1 Tax=Durusdinium trenchii TaxID=1381693 RepID=A0ABP0QRC5_9DINO